MDNSVNPPHNDVLRLRDFAPDDQASVRALILTGLGEHWGWIDETRNPDLDDISAHYTGETFLVAHRGDTLIGTGALVAEGEATGRIVRMSVAAAERRAGIGTLILRELEARAVQRGFRLIVLETTATWGEVIAFYVRNGYRALGERDGDMHFEKVSVP